IPVSRLAVSGPSNTLAGMPFNLTVTAVDAANNPVTGYRGTIHFGSSDGLAVLPSNSKLTSGAGTFSVTLKAAGVQTLAAADTVATGLQGGGLAISVSA